MRNWRLTRHWSRLCDAMGLPELELTMTEQSWLRHVGAKNELILNCQVRVDGLVWWSSRRKWAGRWSGKTAKFLAALADAKAQSCPFILQNRVKAAFVRRWSAGSRLFCGPCVHNVPCWTDDPWQVGVGTLRQCMRWCGTLASDRGV